MGVWKKRNMTSKSLKILYKYDIAFRNVLVHQDLHDLFIETLFWINLCPVKNKLKL